MRGPARQRGKRSTVVLENARVGSRLLGEGRGDGGGEGHGRVRRSRNERHARDAHPKLKRKKKRRCRCELADGMSQQLTIMDFVPANKREDANEGGKA